MRTHLLTSVSAVVLTVFSSSASAQAPLPGENSVPAPTASSRATSYDDAFFAQYAPRTALDIVRRIPGFTLDLGNTDLRGFSGAAGNVVIDGQRPSSKSETLEQLLSRIPASRVSRVDVGPGDLYGAEYSSKAQVANLILKAGGGLAGNVQGTATRWFFGKIVPTGSGSVTLTRGPSTFSLSADAQRYDAFEKGPDHITDGATGALIEDRRKFNFIYQRDPYLSGSWALEQGDNRSIHVNARFSPSRFRLRQVNHVTPVNGPERDDALHQNYKTDIFEVGGDITRPFAGGGLKFLALANRRDRTTFDDYLFRGLGGSPILGGVEQNTRSKLSETIGKLSWSKGDVLGFSFEAGGEVALNKLDYALDLVELGENGERFPINLPLANATVSEVRGEFYVNAGRQLTKTLRADGGLNYEVSRLKVRGDATADRSLKFLKPSLTLDWQPGGGWHTQLILRRTVAQLDFYDFVSVATLSNDTVSGGNANLVPQRTWEGRFVVERPILGAGKARLELGYDQVSLLQDHILVFDAQGKSFDAPGNIGTGRRQFAILNLDAPLDRLWKGLRVSARGMVQKTRVKDPVTGRSRDWSDYFPSWEWSINVRRDAGKFAYGFSLENRDTYYLFRTDGIDNYPNQRAYGAAFVEYRLTPKSSLTFNVDNFLDGGGYVFRELFDPNRTEPIPDTREERFRNGHVRLGLTYKMSFGGAAGVAK